MQYQHTDAFWSKSWTKMTVTTGAAVPITSLFSFHSLLTCSSQGWNVGKFYAMKGCWKSAFPDGVRNLFFGNIFNVTAAILHNGMKKKEISFISRKIELCFAFLNNKDSKFGQKLLTFKVGLTFFGPPRIFIVPHFLFSMIFQWHILHFWPKISSINFFLGLLQYGRYS